MPIGGTLPFDVREKYLTAFIRRSWKDGIYESSRELLKVLSTGKDLDDAVVDMILADMEKKISKGQELLTYHRVGRVTSLNDINLNPIKAMLRERKTLLSTQITNHRYTISRDAIQLKKLHFNEDWINFLDSIKIGRRGQDVYREVALTELEKAFLQGSPSPLLKYNLRDQIYVLNNGSPTFNLPVYPYTGKFKQFNVDAYAELVALTTSSEATQTAFVAQADKMGTTLVKYNYIDKNYTQLDDDVCSTINGKYYSLKPDGEQTRSNGFAPYIWSVLKYPYWVPHPRCKHIARPVVWEFS